MAACACRPGLCLIALSVLLTPAVTAASDDMLTLYVATDGADANPGTAARPFASLQQARDAIRQLKAAGRTDGGVRVLVREGTYFMPEPLVLEPRDSGTAAGPIEYTAVPGRKVVLAGSRPVTGWKRWRGRIWRADLSRARLGANRFWQLFCDGKRQVLARFPDFDPKHPRSGGFAYVAGVVEPGSKTLLQYDPKRLDPARWSRPAEARVHVWPWLNWNRDVCPVKAVDRARHVITLGRRARYKLIRGNRFFVENVFEELNAPGEWYLDTRAKALYFQPPDNRSPEGRTSAPVLTELVRFQGDKAKGRFVEHVRVRGFTLAESQGGLVSLRMAAHCTVAACTLTGSRGTAVTFADRSRHNRLAGCNIAHVGGTAVTVNGVRDWTHSLVNKISHNVITNNHVHHVGEGGNAWGAIRVNPGCGGNCTHDNVISHNLVHDTPRQGISFNGVRNVVEYNHVHHTNQEQSDTGAIGMGSRDIHERGSIVRFNYIHDTGGYNMRKPGVWEYPHYCWGVYLDDYTSGVHVYGNLIVRAFRAGVHVHGGQDNVIESNIIVNSQTAQVEYSPIDHLTRGRTPGHPDTSEWLMTGTKLLGNVFYYTDDKALWLRGRKWKQVVAASDRNVIWHGGKPVKLNLKVSGDTDTWAAWRQLGHDTSSVIADPLFVDPTRDDYRLRPESPAVKLGFKPIPYEKIGLYKSPERASWPVADDCWREEHLVYPEGPPKARDPKKVPKLSAARVSRPPTIDGRADAPEWNWRAKESVGQIDSLSMEDGKGAQPSRVAVACDGQALYVAVVNRVSSVAKLQRHGGKWGRDDGAELCLQVVSGRKPGPIFVLQGFPSGRRTSVADAGAPRALAAKLGRSVKYAATIGKNAWTGEWRIPLPALGVAPGAKQTIRFNVGVRKAAEKQWIAWVSTGGAPWRMDQAGLLVLPAGR